MIISLCKLCKVPTVHYFDHLGVQTVCKASGLSSNAFLKKTHHVQSGWCSLLLLVGGVNVLELWQWTIVFEGVFTALSLRSCSVRLWNHIQCSSCKDTVSGVSYHIFWELSETLCCAFLATHLVFKTRREPEKFLTTWTETLLSIWTKINKKKIRRIPFRFLCGVT